MRFRIGSAFAALALVLSMATVALAQAEDDTPVTDGANAVDSPAAPSIGQPAAMPTLFLILVNPIERDIEVPLETTQFSVQGSTLPGAVVSIDGDLVDTDDQGNFAALTALDEGANEIDVIASDDQGNQLNTSIFVTRGA